MPKTFQIRPLGLLDGFELSGYGLISSPIRHPRLIDAIIHAVQASYGCEGMIHIYDADGSVAESLPVGLPQINCFPELQRHAA